MTSQYGGGEGQAVRVQSDVEGALDRLTPAFAWAATGWAVGQPWCDARPAFLAAVGLQSDDLDEPGHRLLVRFVEYVDTQLLDTERREFLNDPSARSDVVDMFAGGDYAPAGADLALP